MNKIEVLTCCRNFEMCTNAIDSKIVQLSISDCFCESVSVMCEFLHLYKNLGYWLWREERLNWQLNCIISVQWFTALYYTYVNSARYCY